MAHAAGNETPLEAFLSSLEPYRASSVVWLDIDVHGDGTFAGNNGDRLMHEVALHLLDTLDIRPYRRVTPTPVDLVVVPPNGALLEAYKAPWRLAEQLQSFRHTPLIVLPSSCWFPTTDPTAIFAGRSGPTIWMLRERYSYEHLQKAWGRELQAAGVELVLSADVVALGRRILPDILGHARDDGYLLVAARRDSEGAGALSHREAKFVRRAASRLAAASPGGLRLRRIYRNRFDRGYRRTAANLVHSLGAQDQYFVGADHRTMRCADVSDEGFASYSEYKDLVGSAGAVVTDRLHVGLPAALMGKPVVLLDSGYHKVQGVYERSLVSLPHVRLVSR